MARIYKKETKKGVSWGYVVYVGTDPITGKDKRIYKQGFKTQKDAKLAAALVERQIHNGEHIEPTKLTFGDVAKAWLKEYSLNVKESSVRARKIALKHIIDAFGPMPIQKITSNYYQEIINDLSLKFSNNYMDSIFTSANMVFKYAKKHKLISKVPEDVGIPKKKKTVEEIENDDIREKFLEKEELEEFLTVAKKEGLEGDLLTFTMLAYTGLRIGELIALKWADIDYDNQTLRVIRTYYNPTNNKMKYKLLTPKTESSIRTITIDPLLIELLQEHKEKQDKIKQGNKPFYVDNDFIFATNEGYPKTIKHMAIRMDRLLKKTSIKKDVTLHSFRHTHTSLLIEAGVHIKEIQERLGHSDINTTFSVYAHLTQNIKKEASTKFSNLMKDLSKNLSD